MKDPGAFDFDGDYGEVYDDIAATVIPGYATLFQATLALLRAAVPADGRVLVVGAGTGREIETFAPAESGWRITGVDPSGEMIRACGQVVRRLEAQDRVELVCGTVEDLPPVPEFHGVTVLNVLHFLADDGPKQQLVRAVSVRMRPGGLVALFDLHGDPADPAFEVLEAGWIDFMRLRGLAGADLERFRERLRRGIVYVPESRILEICVAEGLELVSRYLGGFHYGGWLLRRRPEP